MDHADIIKNHHQNLRKKFHNGTSENELWCDLLKESDTLKTYSEAMYNLANEDWSKKKDQNRINWCLSKCHEYFHDGGFHKLSKKIYKKFLFDMLNPTNSQEASILEEIKEKTAIHFPEWNYSIENKLLLLDVGSCYNPFGNDKRFLVFAIDIAPACTDVYYLDFLHVEFELSTPPFPLSVDLVESNLKHGKLISGIHDIVVFSLLLSYFPSSKQRLRCCINAHKCLKKFGMLLVITPDSSHQNRHSDMMKSWKTVFERIGFRRWKYEKLEHLHCMVFIKVDDLRDENDLITKYEKYLYIPQDKDFLKN